MNRFISSRLAAKAGTRAADLTLHADSAGEACNAVVQRAWRQLFQRGGMLPGPHNFHANAHYAARVLHAMADGVWQTLHGRLAGMVQWSHHAAASSILTTLPRAYLRAALTTKLTESRDDRPGELLRGTDVVRLVEAGTLAFGLFTPDDPAGGQPQFDAIDLANPLRHEPNFPFGASPDAGPALTPEEERRLFASLLFPPPSVDAINGWLTTLLPSGDWLARIGDGPGGTATPMTLANMIAGTYANGGSTKDVARAIRPYFDDNAMRATRTARTLGAYVGTERQLAVDAGMGDLIIGWQVHNPGGENARPNHALRSGTMYFKDPKGGQVGIDVMPHPPYDTGRGPHDETKPQTGNGVLCWNCRCWMTPILRRLEAMSTPAFTDNADKLIPDPAHYSDWWQTANGQQRRAAAGVRRLETARDVLGREPQWAELLDPATGRLLSVAALRTERLHHRTLRVAKVQQVIARNRAAVRQVAAFGSAV